MARNPYKWSDREVTEWAYAGQIEKTGAVLYDITHDGEKFMKRAALIKSYAWLDDPTKEERELLAFDLGDLSQHGKDRNLRLSNYPARSPDYYHKMTHLAYMTFSTRDLGNTGQSIGGIQKFAFTETSSSPRHETVGIASAGRFYPTINFQVSGFREGRDRAAIHALRFDYWLEPDLREGGRRRPSVFLPAAEVLLMVLDFFSSSWNWEESPPQQGGLFRDRERALTTRLVQTRGVGRPGEQIFSHAEKPLIWEVVADGINAGMTHQTWDNIHIWSYSDKGLVSTPGMPFGIHFHWRWAASATNPAAMVFGNWTPGALRAPELAGRDMQGSMVPGGPLIDPRNPETDLRIALVTKETARKFAEQTPSDPAEFASIFEKLRPTPARIENGGELVLIVSIVVYRRQYNEWWTGSVFPHGMFFPHEHDLGYLAETALTGAGAYSPQYLKSKPAVATWRRNPR
jgi:hypothetical protein